MKLVGKLAIFCVGVFALLQLVRPSIPEKPAEGELRAPANVKHVFEKDCYSCHSNQRRLAWFDEIVPGYWLVRHDILTARERLNFSTLNTKPAAMQEAALYEAVNMMQLGTMPLAQFRLLHPEAKVTDEDLVTLKTYLRPWKDVPPPPVHEAPETSRPRETGVEFNGLRLDGNYKNWKLLSFTDRGDNNTFRFILGNDVAVRAVRSGQIKPWPDGAKLAKLAWQKTRDADGLDRPGGFVQVELMDKNAQQYKKTDGWGWGRWRGLDLKPYGKDAGFTQECTGCHLPVRDDDSVYTLPITSARVEGREIVNNRASLSTKLPYDPLDWFPSTMYVDPARQTAAALFANAAARTQAVGSMLALVTWSERQDPHWFGARIPDQPRSVEFLGIGKGENANGYARYAGPDLTAAALDKNAEQQRVHFIRSLTPARLP